MASSKGVALITGASQGMGKAIALRLANDGYDVAVNDIPRGEENLRSVVQEIEARGRKACYIVGDVSIESDVQNMVATTVATLGSLDVMVANAGIVFIGSVVDTTVEDWDRIFSINTRGVFLCYKYAAKQMIAQGRGGRIVGAASVAGKQGEAWLPAYSATKFAVRGLTQASAHEFGPHGITVNAYAPGAIDTPMLVSLGDARGGLEEMFETEAKRNATGCIGKPDDVASLVSYLVSKEAHFITGQSVSVNGGRFFD